MLLISPVSFFGVILLAMKEIFSQNLSLAEFQEHAQAKNAVVIDIRTHPEIVRGKLLSDALEIDFYAPDFLEKISQIPREKTILLYCLSGNRSGAAIPLVKNLGFLRVAHLSEGYRTIQ